MLAVTYKHLHGNSCRDFQSRQQLWCHPRCLPARLPRRLCAPCPRRGLAQGSDVVPYCRCFVVRCASAVCTKSRARTSGFSFLGNDESLEILAPRVGMAGFFWCIPAPHQPPVCSSALRLFTWQNPSNRILPSPLHAICFSRALLAGHLFEPFDAAYSSRLPSWQLRCRPLSSTT